MLVYRKESLYYHITSPAHLTPSTEGKDATSSRSTSRMKAAVTMGVDDRYSARPNVVTSAMFLTVCRLKMCVKKVCSST